jgi:hypothetical protein
MKTNFPLKTLNHHQTGNRDAQAEYPVPDQDVAPLPALDEMLDDIDRLITHIVTPYVDESNPMLHLDELRAEWRYKLARIIMTGRLQRCATRAKLFGLLKVAFRNHVLTLVQKYVFCWKRTGISSSQRSSPQDDHDGDRYRSKPLHLSLDDEGLGLQLGSTDQPQLLQELMEDLESVLAPEERNFLRDLENCDRPFPRTRCLTTDYCWQSSPRRTNWKLQRCAAGLGMTAEEFTKIMTRIRSKWRIVLTRTSNYDDPC